MQSHMKGKTHSNATGRKTDGKGTRRMEESANTEAQETHQRPPSRRKGGREQETDRKKDTHTHRERERETEQSYKERDAEREREEQQGDRRREKGRDTAVRFQLRKGDP